MTVSLPSRAFIPPPWDPDATRGGGGLLAAGIFVSLLVHSGIPFGGVFWPRSSVSTLPVTIQFESMPLPPAEEVVEAPDELDIDAPDSDEPEPTPTPTPPTKAVPDEPDEPDEPDGKKVEALPDGVAQPPPLAPDLKGDLAQRIAEREQARAEWQAERDKRRLLREARHRARRDRQAAARKGGAPESASQQGTPDPVYLCTATDKGVEVVVRTERPITSWIPIIPTVFAHFETRPGLDKYLEHSNQVYVVRKRIGLMDFAAPAEVLQMKLEEPRGVTIAAGRLDVRCMVGLSYRPKLFPIKLMRMPVRIIDKQNNTVSALVNLTIFKDASIELSPYDNAQPSLPFTQGRLQNSKMIARNIEDHYQAVRLASAFAEFFGFKSTPPKPSTSPPARPRGVVSVPPPTGLPAPANVRIRTNPTKRR